MTRFASSFRKAVWEVMIHERAWTYHMNEPCRYGCTSVARTPAVRLRWERAPACSQYVAVLPALWSSLLGLTLMYVPLSHRGRLELSLDETMF